MTNLVGKTKVVSRGTTGEILGKLISGIDIVSKSKIFSCLSRRRMVWEVYPKLKS